MRKILSLLMGFGLPVVTCAILAGCQSEHKEASSQPAQAAATPAAPAAPAAPAKPMATAQAAPVTATTVRVKAGSPTPFKDSAGNVWLPDQGFDNSDTVERPDAPITGTKDPGLYQSEHYSMTSFSCKIPNGKYIAKLHFCETFESIDGKGQRVFSYNVQGHPFKDFDVFEKAGGANRAYVETVPVEVTNGIFKIDFTSNVENPQINAIEITPQS
jgi:Malectin domain